MESIETPPPQKTALAEMQQAVAALESDPRPRPPTIQGDSFDPKDRQPAPALLRTGEWTRLETRVNRCAGTDHWQVVERAPDGKRLEHPVRVGRSLYTRLLRTPEGDYVLTFRYFHQQLSGWADHGPLPEATTEAREITTVLRFSSEMIGSPLWLQMGGLTGQRTTNGVTKNVNQFLYVRLTTKPPATPE